ncbi:hypothetical protein E2C01_070206 [Portunus trituberculatus]|uniref:Uncharacterized protein n=1 Tax=Portunus trituberculatus TaxID=210409 RepID=A0A5B7I1N1_PORTR|nr:hypothetical protein [Portunus trituberculatus]
MTPSLCVACTVTHATRNTGAALYTIIASSPRKQRNKGTGRVSSSTRRDIRRSVTLRYGKVPQYYIYGTSNTNPHHTHSTSHPHPRTPKASHAYPIKPNPHHICTQDLNLVMHEEDNIRTS